MKQKTILFLSYTDQRESNLAKYHNLGLIGSYDRDKNWYKSFKEIFSKVIRYEYMKRLVEVGAIMVQDEIISIVKMNKPDYVILPMSMYEIRESTLQKIRELGSLVILNFADDECRFENYGKWWIPYFDYCITNDKKAVRKYEQLNARGIYTKCAANPDIYKKLNVKKEIDVSFIGAKISNRELYVEGIRVRNISLDVFGQGWSNFITFDRMIKIFNSSRINLNFTGSYSNPKIKQIKARIFEIPMCGGFLLTEYVPGLEEYFEIGKEIVCFRTVNEAVEKIKYYLKHVVERETIAQAGCQRAHRDHTWKTRLKNIFDEIENDININGRPSTYKADIKMPGYIRKIYVNYHYNWAKALLCENNIKLCRDEIDLGLSYGIFDKKMYFLRLATHFPKVIRQILVKMVGLNLLFRLKARLKSYLKRVNFKEKTI